ncbi:MAG: glycosyltransferase [Paludibacteraceae bacterium]|nr:glycosyltransferase [Paludibacteraceae bacterium]
MNNRLTILYIAGDSSLGGSTASLYNLINGLQNVVTPIVLFAEEGVGVDFYRERGIDCYVVPFLNLSLLRSNRFCDIWLHLWRWHYIKKVRQDVKCVWDVRHLLSGRKIDIVHTNTSINDIGIMLARLFHAKHVWHIREFLDIDFHMTIYRGIPHLRKLVNRADARIAISSAIKEHWKLRNKNTWIINDAVRCKNDAIYIPAKEKYVLFCSYYLTEAKGARSAIIAFAESGVWKNDFRLKLVGSCDKAFYQSLIKTARMYHVEEYVDVINNQSDVKSLFSKASAFLMTSENEGLGRVTAEAMFYGCPVIARATGGTLDLIKHGETGWLFNSIEECSRLIKKVCKEDQTEIISRAQDFAIHNLSEEVYAPKILEVYQNVLKM